jgi:hypothetical protein
MFGMDSLIALGMLLGGRCSRPEAFAPLPMPRSSLCYRGLRYDHSHDQPPSASPVDHTYRGHHYVAPLRHQPCPTVEAHDLIYRGNHYQPRHV